MSFKNVFKKIIKYGLNQFQYVVVAIAQFLGLIDFPVPSNSIMRKTSSRSISHYYVSGIQTSLPIVTCALREGIKLQEKIRILDFGCGAGRQLQHFTRHFPNPYYYACDIDETSIAFIEQNYPNVRAHTNSFRPPLMYEDSFFGMVYSVSIFSHLCLEDQTTWLTELARITKSGGFCFLTTEGKSSIKILSRHFLSDEYQLYDDLMHHGVLYKEYENLEESIRNQNTLKKASHFVGVEGSYGTTVMSPEFIIEAWNTSSFDVVDILEGIIDYLQDLVILRRK